MATGKSLGVVNKPPASEPIANTPAEVERAAEYARKTWGDRAEISARSDCEDHWAIDVLEAMKKSKAEGGYSYSLAAKILRRWWTEQGGTHKHTPACKIAAKRTPARPERTAEEIATELHVVRSIEAADRRRQEQAAARRTIPMNRAV